MRTLIVIDNLNTGGVASSLYNYLQVASLDMDCDLLVFDEESINQEKIPKNVKIMKSSKILHVLGKKYKNVLKESKILGLYKLILVLLSRVFNGGFARKFLNCFIKTVGEYDLAISYAQDDGWKSLSKGCNDFVLKKVKAKKKVTIIHCDYKNFGGYHSKQINQYKRFDYIICVSNSCKNSLSECFPKLKEKTIVCENFINIDKIKKEVKHPITYNNKTFNFISICRLSPVKGLDRAIDIFKELTDEKIDNFSWTIVGEGTEYDKLLLKIKEYKLENKISLVGNQSNPYQYLKNASALLITSIHEAAPMVYGESATLKVPIITVETCSAIELVEKRKIGIVVENNRESIKNIIKKVIKDSSILERFKDLNYDVNYNAIRQYKNFLKLLNVANEKEITNENKEK